MLISHTTFSGGVTNAGTIGPHGISVISSTFLSGGIFDDGIIAGGINIDSHSRIVGSGVSAVAIENPPTFGGGVTNNGTINTTKDGITAGSISLFSGGIKNKGTISASFSGIQ